MQTKYQSIEEWRAAQALRQRVWRAKVKERVAERKAVRLGPIKEVKGGTVAELELV